MPRHLPSLRRGDKAVGVGDRLRSADNIAGRPASSDKIDTGLTQDALIGSSSLLNTDFNLYQFGMGFDGSPSNLVFDGFEGSDTATCSTIAPATEDSGPMASLTQASGRDEASTPTSPSLTCSPGRATCLCSEILKVYETVEGTLAWAQSKSSTDELMCQKEVLRSCDKWLNQDASHIRSQHAVLMISVLDRLLANILSMANTPDNQKGGDGVPTSPVSPGGLSSDASWQEWPSQEMLMSTMETGNILHADELWMDNEERIHVFKSLLNFRTSRLKALLERLGAIAASNRWQMQTSMVRNLLNRLPKHPDLS